MKVAIIAFANIRLTPYLKNYTDILDKNKISYEIIYWDRKNEDESLMGIRTHRFSTPMDDMLPKYIKLFYMKKYAYYAIKTIKNEQYSQVIVLTTLLGYLMSNFLISHYQGKYIIDIRDYSYEHITFYYKKIGKILNHSLLNVISSPGFKEFLPNEETVICHNMVFTQSKYFFENHTNPLRIAFVGIVRYGNECEKFLKAIANDERIVFTFYGDGEDEDRLKKFCQKNEINNVHFSGKYFPNEKNDIYKNIDIIYNCYGNETAEVKYALSNKYYDSLYYRKPILVNSNTCMEMYARGLCFSVDNYNNILVDNIVEWYDRLDASEVMKLCEKRLETAVSENEKFTRCITEIIK